MSRKIRLWYICGIIALGLFVPSLMLGQELPGALQTEMNIPSQAPDLNVSQDEKPITLEELKKMFGARNVCGAPCGRFQEKCYISCGEAAQCWSGFCIYSR
ncbi:MAG: hypothetical protein QOH06_868 [Acidobacteriota bacterium]|nr:hypothetical protein [Acidobacteriota bacterium]